LKSTPRPARFGRHAGLDPASRNSKHRNHLYEISFHKDKVSSLIKLANRPAAALDSGVRRNDKSLCDNPNLFFA